MSKHGITSADAPKVADVLEMLMDPLGYSSLDGWRRDVAAELRRVLGADMVTFQLPHRGVDLLYSADFGSDLNRDYTSYFLPELVRTKSYARRIEKIGIGNRSIMWGHELDWLHQSEYYNDFVAPNHAFDPVWAAVPVPGRELPAILLAHHGSRRGTRFGQRGLDIMRILRPGLSAAIAAVQRPLQYRERLTSSMDHPTTPMVAVAAGGDIVHQNPAATELFETPLTGPQMRNAVLTVADDALSSESEGVRGPGAMRVVARGDGARYSLNAIATPTSDFGHHAVVLVLIEREDDGRPATEELGRRFGLTPRQADVALLLADRKTSKEIARRLELSTSTARHHVEAVLRCLGVHSRRDVASRIAGD